MRTGVFTTAGYWLTMAISLAFMIPVDGWLTKLSAPIVIYRDRDVSGVRPVWDILVEEYAYAFALLTLVILLWERARRRGGGAGVIGLALGSAGFLAMEGVSYASHRWVMHRFGMVWHRSHHRRATAGGRPTTCSPLSFSVIGFVLFVLAIGTPWLRPVAVGVTAYGGGRTCSCTRCTSRAAAVAVPPNAYLEHLRTRTRSITASAASPTGCCCPSCPGRSASGRRRPTRPPSSPGGRAPARSAAGCSAGWR